MRRGKLNKQIAFELGTSERTIKAHRHAVMEKVQVQFWRSSCPSRSGLASSLRPWAEGKADLACFELH